EPLAQLAPPPDRTLEAVLLDRPHPAIERGPHHDAPVGEVVDVAPHLPDAVVLAVEVLLAVLEQAALEPPRVLVLLDARRAQLVQRDHDLADDVRLVLVRRAVADAHGP